MAEDGDVEMKRQRETDGDAATSTSGEDSSDEVGGVILHEPMEPCTFSVQLSCLRSVACKLAG